MSYDYSPRTLEAWDWPAQAETYRQKYLNEKRNAAYWQARAKHAETGGTPAAEWASNRAPRAREEGAANV